MDTFATYNCIDGATTFKCHDEIFQEISETGFEETYEMTIDLLPALQYMHIRGIKVAGHRLNEIRERADADIERLQDELDTIVGYPLNVSSPKQCIQYFYIEKGLYAHKNRNTGEVTCDDKALAAMVAKGVKEAKLVQEIRYLGKLRNTYLAVLLDPDGRLRCSWNPRGTKFGRLSSSKTIFQRGLNLQNIHPEFRRLMVADENNILLSWDKAQAEWIVTAYAAQEMNMIKVIESGEDPHCATGSLLTGLSIDTVAEEDKIIGKMQDRAAIHSLRTKKLPHIFDNATFLPANMSIRQAGKKSNHGLNYDEGPLRFALENEIPAAEGKRIHALYHAAYPGLRLYYKDVQSTLYETRTLVNCFNRRIRLLDLLNSDLFKSAYSFLPQSTIADCVLQGMILSYSDPHPDMEGFDLLSTIHDDINAQHVLGNWRAIARVVHRVVKNMNPTLSYHGRDFNVGTDLKIGLNFGDSHPDRNPTGMTSCPIVPNITE